MTSRATIAGSSLIKVGEQTATYLGNSAFFNTYGNVSYNIVITNTATGNTSRKMKIGIGTVGTISEPGGAPDFEPPDLLLTTTFQRRNDGTSDVLADTLDGVSFRIDPGRSRLDLINGADYLEDGILYTGTVLSSDFLVQLDVVGLAAVPEPASLAMLGLGLPIALVAWRRRRAA